MRHLIDLLKAMIKYKKNHKRSELLSGFYNIKQPLKKLALHTNEDTKIKNKMATPFHEEIDYIRMYSATFGSKHQYILVIKFLLNIVSSREIVINRFYPPEHRFLASSTVRCCMSVRTPALQRGHRTS